MINEQEKERILASHKKDKNNRVRNFFIVFILIIMTTIISLFLPVFNINSIKISGNNKITEEKIRNLLDINIGDNIIRADIKNASKRIEDIPYIKQAIISRNFPDKIEVLIEERTPVGYIRFMGEYILIDREGYVLEVISHLDKYNILLIEGLSFKHFSLGKKILVKDEKKLEVMVECLTEIVNTNLDNVIDSINVNSTDKIKVEVDNRITGIIGETKDLNYKLCFFKEILQQLKEGQNGYVDLRTKNPTFTEIK